MKRKIISLILAVSFISTIIFMGISSKEYLSLTSTDIYEAVIVQEGMLVYDPKGASQRQSGTYDYAKHEEEYDEIQQIPNELEVEEGMLFYDPKGASNRSARIPTTAPTTYRPIYPYFGNWNGATVNKDYYSEYNFTVGTPIKTTANTMYSLDLYNADTGAYVASVIPFKDSNGNYNATVTPTSNYYFMITHTDPSPATSSSYTIG